jgi:diguanylate cyclase (GGDEF)-like protein/PAS domain S-box-containing protein/excisionase family DNA binding protein
MPSPIADLARVAAALLAERRRAGASGVPEVAGLIGERFEGCCLIYLRSEALDALVPVAGGHENLDVLASIEEFTAGITQWQGSRLAQAVGACEVVTLRGTPAELGEWVSGPAADHFLRTDVRALLAVPVRVADTVVAGISIGRHGPEAAYSPADLAALEALAGELAQALDHERLARVLRERLEAHERDGHARQRFAAAFQEAAIGMALFTLGPRPITLLEVNRVFSEIAGATPEELRAEPAPGMLIHPDDHAAGRAAMESLLSGATPVYELEQRIQRPRGAPLLCRVSLSLLRDGDGVPVYGLCQVQDISMRRGYEQELEHEARRQDLLTGLRRSALEVGRVAELGGVAASTVASALTPEAACVLELTPAGEVAIQAVAGSRAELATALAEAGDVLDGCRHEACVIDLPGADGVRAALAPIGRGESPSGWLAALTARALSRGELYFLESAAHVLTAAAEHETAEREARHHALHDPLTGLPNRALLIDRLKHAGARAARAGEALALICLDVDRFAEVNDTLGRTAGDELLRVLAGRLGDTIRCEDTLAHLGGDEFAILCEDVDGERGAVEVAQRVVAAFAAPLPLGGGEQYVSASLGVVVGRSALADGLLRDAEVALHRAKQRPGGYELFDGDMRRRVIERSQLERDLRRALERDELVLHYQPLVSLRDRRILGVEALVRWRHPERGLISPADFIPLAEESGLIVAVGRWVLDEACRRLAGWADERIYVSVNLSGRQLSAPGLIEDVAETLRRSGVAPERLALELTETVLMAEIGSPAAVLQRLEALGVRLLLDDFGTGYSSLNYVKRFPLAAIKVDRSFISGIATEESDRHIVRAIVSMAAALDVAVIAEGVETLAQASWLAGIGCDGAQGFGLARPAPAEAIEPLLLAGLPPERLAWTIGTPAGDTTANRPRAALAAEPTVPLNEAAQALGVSASTLRRWADTGRIEAIRTPGGHRRFPADAVRRLSAETLARPGLRKIALPAPPLPELAQLLDGDGTMVTVAARSLYEPGRPGWFASESGAPAMEQWAGAVARSCRAAEYSGAVDATRRLAAQAGYASLSLLERHALVERVGDFALRRLQEQRLPRETLVDVRRLFVRLRQSVLDEPGG